MANVLGVYNPIMYANEALIHLEKALGLTGRVHRGFEEERRRFEKGDTINIRKPSTFTAQDAPSTAVDLKTETVAIVVDKWKEVKFKLTDKEQAFTTERIVADHIRPAAYALADDIDLKLAALYKDVPWFFDMSGSQTAADLTGVRKILFDNAVPTDDPGMLHVMLDSTEQAGFLALPAFSQQQGAGDMGVNTQMRGSLGMKYGLEIFANQNVQTHTKGTASVTALLVNGTFLAGVTSIDFDAAAVTGTLVAGDTFVIAGNTQRYAVTALNTAATNAFTAVAFTPALVVAPADNAAVTVELDDHSAMMAFHRNAFALVLAPLPDAAKELGAKVQTVADPVTGLSIRARVYYVGDSSEVHVALDVLYGIKTLDPNLAMRPRGA